MELQSKQTAKIPMDDDKIVELYWERDEKAIEETDFKYKKYLFPLLTMWFTIGLIARNA